MIPAPPPRPGRPGRGGSSITQPRGSRGRRLPRPDVLRLHASALGLRGSYTVCRGALRRDQVHCLEPWLNSSPSDIAHTSKVAAPSSPTQHEHGGPGDEVSAIARALGVGGGQVAAAIGLLDQGNTLPFIARYRKEATGGLDDGQLRQLVEMLEAHRALEARRQTVLHSIAEQGLLTEALEAAIRGATGRSALEDLYLPYRPKRRTRAMMAREKGLSGLAELIVAQVRGDKGREALARPFISRQAATPEEAYAGARDIVAEQVAEEAGIRSRLREKGLRWGSLEAKAVPGAEDPRGVYEAYRAFRSPLDRVQPYQVLALDRAEAEAQLRVSIRLAERDWRDAIAERFRPDPRSPLAEDLALAIEDAAERLLLPAIERDLRRQLTQGAQMHAIGVFARNLKALLMQPPLAGHRILGVDPGYRSGCKLAVVDDTGRLLHTETLSGLALSGPAQDQARGRMADTVRRHGVSLVAIGNGTGGREVEAQVARLCAELEGLRYLMVSEAGASVYSASAQAAAELPALDVSLRGAVSIARRALDPLAELVKIPPESIGVGLYQHDLDAKALGRSLAGVVEDAVNAVGVELNTASGALLEHVAGIGPKLAAAIVQHRETAGPFKRRVDLKAVGGLGAKSFEQSAGFLRIRGGSEPLDASAIHPESYAPARRLLQLSGLSPDSDPADRHEPLAALLTQRGEEALATDLGVGLPTLRDLVAQLLRPGRDPRADLPPPLLRADVLNMEDLLPGMRLAGTVRNVVDFGAFVDIGVKQDGLLHKSALPRGQALAPGQVIGVEVLRVEADRGRIALAWAGEGSTEAG